MNTPSNHSGHVITAHSHSTFTPSMKRGCEETKRFAMKSNAAVEDNGAVSLVISANVTDEALGKAIAILEARRRQSALSKATGEQG